MSIASGNGSRVVDWTPAQASLFGEKAFIGRHRLHELCCFTDEALTLLLEHHARERLQIFCSGTDPHRVREDWHRVEARRASPAEIMAALHKGRLWVNLQRIERSDAFGPLVGALYEDLRQCCAGFRPSGIHASLFISSPGAIVYYHADPSPSLLWHLRGTKRVWVYPAQDVRLMPQSLMEDVFAGTVDEAPFSQAFDEHASVFDLRPGDVASWPQNAPHRVSGLEGLNVSLTTIHWTEAGDRRRLVYLSNRYLRRCLGLPARSVAERGVVPDIKCLTYRVCNRFGLGAGRIGPSDSAYRDRARDAARFRIDAASPSGIRPI